MRRPMRRSFLGLIPASCFIILRASSNCLISAFTCCVVVPEPRAMRARREPLRIFGLARSCGVIDWMIASTRFRSRSPTSARQSCWLIPGSIPSTWLSGPIFFTCCSWSRKSSRVNEASRSLRSIASARSRSTVSSARSISVSTSPMPRIRPASRSGWKASRSASFSPLVANFTGLPVTARIDSAAPPRASPSSFVRITPVTSTPSWKASAVCTASWPVIASTTSSTSVGCTASLIAAACAIISASTASRPAVSTTSTSRPVRSASARAPRATATGSPRPEPSSGAYTGTLACSPSTCSCRTAAGRCRSHATRSGRRCLVASQRASLAAVLVLPEPCSPASSTTVGGRGANASGSLRSPRVAISSSWTILMTCCAGVRLRVTSSPTARSRTRLTKSLTTRKLTSASSRARRTSRRAASTCASDSRPCPRSLVKMSCRRSERESNTGGGPFLRHERSSGSHKDSAPGATRPGHLASASSARSASTKASGSNGARSCSPSPRPTSLTGMPSSRWTATTMPPLAVPSSLVRTSPVPPTPPVNCLAWARPFWPVVASRTRMTSRTLPPSRCSTRRTFLSSSMRLVLVWRRPAVSTSRTSAPLARAEARASKATAAGSAPCWWRTTCAPTRSPQRSSCSVAAARKVSAAASTERLPSSARARASLPQVVVLPVPLTPTTRTMAGRSESGTRSRARLRSAAPTASSSSGRSASPAWARERSRSISSPVVATPTSAASRASSSSSQAASSPVPRASRPARPRERAARERPRRSRKRRLGAISSTSAGSAPGRSSGRATSVTARVAAGGEPASSPTPGSRSTTAWRWLSARWRERRPATSGTTAIRATTSRAATTTSRTSGSTSALHLQRGRPVRSRASVRDRVATVAARLGGPAVRGGAALQVDLGDRGACLPAHRRGLVAQPLADHLADSFGLHADAVEGVGRLHGAPLVGDDQELGVLAGVVQQVEEALQVDVVERRLDLVEHVEGARPGAEDGEAEGQGGKAALAAGQQRQAAHALAGWPRLDLDAGGEQVVGLGQDQAAVAAGEQQGEGALELRGDVAEGLAEDLADALVDGADHLEEVPAALLEVLQLAGEEGVALLEGIELLQGERVDAAEQGQAPVQGGGDAPQLLAGKPAGVFLRQLRQLGLVREVLAHGVVRLDGELLDHARGQVLGAHAGLDPGGVAGAAGGAVLVERRGGLAPPAAGIVELGTGAAHSLDQAVPLGLGGGERPFQAGEHGAGQPGGLVGTAAALQLLAPGGDGGGLLLQVTLLLGDHGQPLAQAAGVDLGVADGAAGVLDPGVEGLELAFGALQLGR